MATMAKQTKMEATPRMRQTTKKTVFCASCGTGIGDGFHLVVSAERRRRKKEEEEVQAALPLKLLPGWVEKGTLCTNAASGVYH